MKRCDKMVEVGRRQFLRRRFRGRRRNPGGWPRRGTGQGRHLTARCLTTHPQSSPTSRTSKSTSQKTSPIPDADAPGVLIKLGKAVEGGAGPDGDIVGFTTVCPHKGFPLSYNADSRTMNCPGHYSVFDCEAGGQQTWGQATQNLPQYMLRVDDKGDIYAEGVDELLYGRLSNVL